MITRWSVLVGAPPGHRVAKLQPRTFAGPEAKRAGAVVDVPLPEPGTYSYLSFAEQLPIISGQGFGLIAFLSNRAEGAAAVPLLAEDPNGASSATGTARSRRPKKASTKPATTPSC